MKNVYVIDHPLVQHHLVSLRDRGTRPGAFRRMVERLSMLLVYEASKDFETTAVQVRTPLAMAKGKVLRQRIGLIPILRAGLGMVDPAFNLISGAEVWHLGIYRDEKTHKPVEYYSKLPEGKAVDKKLNKNAYIVPGLGDAGDRIFNAQAT